MSRGAQAVYTEFAAQVEAQGLGERVVQTQCGCVAPLCGRGPVVCAYPSGAWYVGVTPGDCAEVVGTDLSGGALVGRLLAEHVAR